MASYENSKRTVKFVDAMNGTCTHPSVTNTQTLPVFGMILKPWTAKLGKPKMACYDCSSKHKDWPPDPDT